MPHFRAVMFQFLAAICFLFMALPVIAAPDKVIDITKAGVVGDGATLNTVHIQKAIDDCAAAGGGTIRFPAGRYLTGTIQIKSHVTLQLDPQATLLGSTDAADYRNLDPFIAGDGAPLGYALIVAVDADGVGLEGPGTVDGQGAQVAARQKPFTIRPFLVRWVRCTNVTVSSVHLTNPGAWTLEFFGTKGAVIDGVTIRSRDEKLRNNDGIDLDSTRDVQVHNCDVISGDDALVIKSTGAQPSRDIVAADCKFSSHTNAIKLGTESYGGFENITVSRCQVAKTDMSGIALYTVDGGDLRHVTISDVTMDGVMVPISIRLGARLKTFRVGDLPKPVPGHLSDITIKNVTAKNIGLIGILINGVPGHPVEAVTLQNIQMTLPGGGTAAAAQVQLPEKAAAYPEYSMFGKTLPASGLYARHVRGLTLQNVQMTSLQPDARPASVFVDTQDVTPPAAAAATASQPIAGPEKSSLPGLTTPAADEMALLTPPPPATPHLNAARIFGVRPGAPFLYRIPCTGERPINFAASHLPPGLSLDAKSGIITGRIAKAGRYSATLIAENSRGKDTRKFNILVGQTLALTPPMGWNSWYIHYDRVSEDKMRDAADQMIATGMADYGYQYVNIDDGWSKKQGDEPYRDANGVVLPNAKFPDIKGLANYIHSKGLKAGLYTSPGPWTCGGHVGAYGHEAADARTFAEWGYDFLKYDWCSYGQTDPRRLWPNAQERTTYERNFLKTPYLKMGALVKQQPRDMIFNLCQYGMGAVWTWGAAAGNSWRTTDDLGLAAGDNLPGFYHVAFSNMSHADNAHPGAWNDPDYILIGWVGDARGMGIGKPSKLTGNEQYSYMSLWSLMAAPLIFGGDMAKLDPFTLNVLCNSEVIDIDQDVLGKQARVLRYTATELVLVKPLEDGSKAVGLFSLNESPENISVTWSDLGLKGPQTVRDLWRQKDMGTFTGEFSSGVSRHGVTLVRVFSSK